MREASPIQPEVAIVDPRGDENRAPQTSSVLEWVFVALFAQICLLMVISLVMQDGPMFVGRDPVHGFGMDFFDYYQASTYQANHVNPYLVKRFVTPPFSLLVGIPFGRLPFNEARYLFFLVNLCCLVAALSGSAQQLRFTGREAALFFMIAGIYYPVLFLLDRGNIDGVVLAVLVFAFRTRHRVLGILLFAVSIALKLYSGLLAIAFARQKRWALAFGGFALAAVLQMPWWHLATQYPHVIAARGSRMLPVENVSPALLAGTLLQAIHLPGWQWIYVMVWLATLIWAISRFAPSEDTPANWVLFTPWMVAIPLVVYPYSLVLALPLIAYVAALAKRKPVDLPSRLIIFGFVLTGTQQTAWMLSFLHFTRSTVWVYYLNSLGTGLLLAGALMFVSRTRRTATAGIAFQ